eukprot:Lithocolla_globosa_v1_NODE_6438_length_1087_cov_18.549419.p2 type:complete len:120 gc:universal NODE_6438_length_1087_cov_18.549419:538-897(+)
MRWSGNGPSRDVLIAFTMLSCKCAGTPSLIWRRNSNLLFPHEYSIPTPAVSGLHLTDIKQICPLSSIKACKADFSSLKSRQLERTVFKLNSGFLLSAVIPFFHNPRSQTTCLKPFGFPT